MILSFFVAAVIAGLTIKKHFSFHEKYVTHVLTVTQWKHDSHSFIGRVKLLDVENLFLETVHWLIFHAACSLENWFVKSWLTIWDFLFLFCWTLQKKKSSSINHSFYDSKWHSAENVSYTYIFHGQWLRKQGPLIAGHKNAS